MTKEDLLARVQELHRLVNESLENHQRLKTVLDNATSAHNALVGRLDEAKYMYDNFAENDDKKEQSKEGEVTKKSLK